MLADIIYAGLNWFIGYKCLKHVVEKNYKKFGPVVSIGFNTVANIISIAFIFAHYRQQQQQRQNAFCSIVGSE